MIKENPEKRLEKEITILENSLIDAEIKKINKEEFSIEINIDGQKINDILDMDITFLMVVGPGFPYKPPKLYCLTLFCLPSIADGRDLLEDVLNSNWNTSIRLIDIIEKIPNFLFTFINHLQEGMLFLVGSYYLGDKYELSMFQNLPVYLKKIKEKTEIASKKVEYDNRYIMISDLHICVFEYDRWTLKNNNLTLLFWANIRSILSIKRLSDENVVRFVFKNKYKKPNYELMFTIEDNSEEFITKILKIMGTLGIKFNVKKNEEKAGEKPMLDVDSLEYSIAEIEAKIQIESSKEDIEKLKELYQKVIEYYNAADKIKYELYLGKLHILSGSPRAEVHENDKLNYNKVMDKEENDVRISEDVKLNPQLEVIQSETKLIAEESHVTNSNEKRPIINIQNIDNNKVNIANKTQKSIESNTEETKKQKKDNLDKSPTNNQITPTPLVKNEEKKEKLDKSPINNQKPSILLVKNEEKKETVDKPLTMISNLPIKKDEKKEDVLKVKPLNEPSNTDGITIDNSDNLPNFDEGEESPDSDT